VVGLLSRPLRDSLTAAIIASLAVGGTAFAAEVTFGEPSVLCTIDDGRLAGLSGMADTPQGLMMITDNRPQIFRLSKNCKPRVHLTLPESSPTIDVEDLAATADGTLWIADTGGNRVPRSEVALLRWVPGEPEPSTYTLKYPEGERDAEALLVDMRESPAIVTKEPAGDSAVLVPRGRVDPGRSGDLVQIGSLSVGSWPGSDPAAPGSLLITGGAVAPSGVHVALRTYTHAYEWDAPDGDVVNAIVSRPPDRDVKLPPSTQGESITYSRDGRSLLVGSEQTPSTVDSIPITRTAPEPVEVAGLGVRELAAGALGAAVGWLLVSRSRSKGAEE
jgi:hypothetical protein